MVQSFSQPPITALTLDSTPTIGGSFGAPPIVSDGIGGTVKALSGLVDLGLKVNDVIDSRAALKQAEAIKAAGETVALSHSDKRAVDATVGQVVKIDQQAQQGRLPIDRRDQEMKRLLDSTPSYLKTDVLKQLRNMGIEDPAQALIKRQSIVQENAIQVKLKEDQALVNIGIKSGNPNVYNTIGVPESGINSEKARLIGLRSQQKSILNTAALSTLGIAASGSGGGGTSGTSGIRPSASLRIDPVVAQMRADAVNIGIDSGVDALISQSSAIVAKLSNPSSALSNKDISLMVSALHDNKNKMLSSIQSDLLKTGAFNASELKNLNDQITSVWNQFVFDGSKKRIDEFKNKTIILDAMNRRDGRILREKVPVLSALSKMDRNLVGALLSNGDAWSKLMSNLNDAKQAIEKVNSPSFDAKKNTKTTNEALGKAYILAINNKAINSGEITTVEKANEVLNTGKAMVEATGGGLPDPFKDVSIIDALASNNNISSLVRASTIGTADKTVIKYTYNTMLNTSERLLKRISEKPGFGSVFAIANNAGTFTVVEKSLIAPGSDIKIGNSIPTPQFMYTNPTVLLEVKKELDRVNRYVGAADRIAVSIKAPIKLDMAVLDSRILPTPTQTKQEQSQLITQPTVNLDIKNIALQPYDAARLYSEAYQAGGDKNIQFKFNTKVSELSGKAHNEAQINSLLDSVMPLFSGDENTSPSKLRDMMYKISLIESGGGGADVQKGGGPAVGWWQVEPSTARDLIKNSSALLGNKVQAFLGMTLDEIKSMNDNTFTTFLKEPKVNLVFATAKLLAGAKSKGVIGELQ